MQPLFSIFVLIFLYGCQFTGSKSIAENGEKKESDSLPQKLIAEVFITKNNPSFDDTIPSYSNLVFEKKETLVSAPGTKSVLFNSSGSRLYAMNLEGMSVSEFDQPTRKILREFKFRPTKGMGWDYENDTAISSYEEKPGF